MNDSYGTKTTDSYQQEVHDSLAKLEACMLSFEGFSYFLQIVRERLSLQFPERHKPELFVFGSSVPEALVRASGASACRILGGSFLAAVWSDDAVPRDADPISRSSLGYLLDEPCPDRPGPDFDPCDQ